MKKIFLLAFIGSAFFLAGCEKKTTSQATDAVPDGLMTKTKPKPVVVVSVPELVLQSMLEDGDGPFDKTAAKKMKGLDDDLRKGSEKPGRPIITTFCCRCGDSSRCCTCGDSLKLMFGPPIRLIEFYNNSEKKPIPAKSKEGDGYTIVTIPTAGVDGNDVEMKVKGDLEKEISVKFGYLDKKLTLGANKK